MMSQLDLHPSSAAQNRAGAMESSPLSGLYRRSGKRALDVALVLAAAPELVCRCQDEEPGTDPDEHRPDEGEEGR